MGQIHYAKLTSKNQLTLPAAAVRTVGSPVYFRVYVEENALVLVPAALTDADRVQDAFRQLGITPAVLAKAKRLVREEEKTRNSSGS